MLVFVRDSYLRIRIEAIAQLKKVDPYFATQGAQLAQLVKTMNPFMLLVDLSGLDSGWIFRHISTVRMQKVDFPIVAIVPSMQEALKERAERYGCNLVLTKSQVLKKLPKTIDAAFGRNL